MLGRSVLCLLSVALPTALFSHVEAQVQADGTISASAPRANGAMVAMRDRLVIFGGAYALNYNTTDQTIISTTTQISTNMTQLFYETMNLQDTYIAPPPAGQYNPLGTEFIECDTDLSKIYCFGGRPAVDAPGVFWNHAAEWDGSAFMTGIVPKIRGRYLTNSAVLGRTYYVFGGFIGGEEELNDLYAVNLTDWEEAAVVPSSPTVPKPTQDGCMVAISPTQFVYFGGYENTNATQIQYTNEFFVYDSTTNIWTEISSKVTNQPAGRQMSSCAVSNDGKIYLFGGARSRQRWFNEVQRLDLATLQWSLVSPNVTNPSPETPSVRLGSHIAVVGNYLVVYGGYTRDTEDNRFAEDRKFYFLDTVRNVWVNASTVVADESFKKPTVGPPSKSPLTIQLGTNGTSVTPTPGDSVDGNNKDSKPKSGSTNIGAIVGGVVGGLALVVILVVAVMYFRRQNALEKKNAGHESFYVPPAPVVTVQAPHYKP